MEQVVSFQVRRRKVAVGHALLVAVFVSRFAEVSGIVGEQTAVFLDLAPGFFVLHFRQPNLARRGGEADLDGLLVVLQNEMPVAPRGAMTFISTRLPAA